MFLIGFSQDIILDVRERSSQITSDRKKTEKDVHPSGTQEIDLFLVEGV
jgi:hypothetical protein